MEDTELKTPETLEEISESQRLGCFVPFIVGLALLIALIMGCITFYHWAFPLVPEVAGLTQSEAEGALYEAGLSYTVEECYHRRSEAGTVLSQSVLSGIRHSRNNPIVLSVSLGKAPLPMENLVGLTLDDATAVMEQRGWSVQVEEAFSDSVPAGQVMEQSVPAGEWNLSEITSVTLTVSKGPEAGGIPNVMGKNGEKAADTLKKAGCKVVAKWAYEEGTKGSVIYQQPAAGAPLKEGETVTIILSMGESRIEIPDLHGMGRMEAALTLTKLGLTYTFAYQSNKDYKYDHVCWQSVAPGQSLLKGENVFFYLAK